MNYSKKLYEASELFYQLIIIFGENVCGHYNHQSYLMKYLLQYHFFILDFNLLSCELDNFKFKLLN